MSLVGLCREKPCRRLIPFRTFLSRARDETASDTAQWKEGCDSFVAGQVAVIVVVMAVGRTRRGEDPWGGEGMAGVGRGDVQPRDPKRYLEGLDACVEGTNHQGERHRLCSGL